ncbi:MAG TPA: hypothetical protein VNL70_05705, partial [Tepidisphaeraceae bacterium]|nr:hypothetical protein [Tepidisphaeraceae bacterium]
NDADPPHPDVYHSYANTSNIIIYGVTATDALTRSRGIAMTVGADNVAIVNATVNAGGGAGMVFQFGGDVTNMLVKDSSFTGSAQFYTSWAGQTYTYRDVVVDNTTFSQSPGTPPGVIYR